MCEIQGKYVNETETLKTASWCSQIIIPINTLWSNFTKDGHFDRKMKTRCQKAAW